MPDDSVGLVDLDYLESISGGDREFEQELFCVFVATAPEMVDDIGSAWKAGDPDALFRAAHKLKGSARAVGVTRLGDLCFEIERAGRAGSAGAVSSEMIAELTKVVREVADYWEVAYCPAA